jgi:hypothetical protein
LLTVPGCRRDFLGNHRSLRKFVQQANPPGLNETKNDWSEQMKLSVISSLALATAMLVSGNVYAQDTMAAPTMIGQQTISAEDLPKVQAQCDTLNSAQGGSQASTTTTTDSPDGASDTTDPATEVPNGTDAATATIDLSLITLEECKTAGLVK